MTEKLKKVFIYLLFILLGVAFLKHFIRFPIISLAVLGVIIFISYKIKIPKFAFFLFVVALVLRLITIFIFKTPIQSDYAVMYDMANDLINGNWSAVSESLYMTRYGYQMGYTMLMYVLMLIVKGPLLIKIINCIFSAGIVVFIYLIAKEFTSEKSARVVSICYMIFPFPLLFNTVLSNQHISSFMFLLAIWLLVAKKTESMNEKLKYTLIGLTLAIGNIIRPEAIVIITSILIFILLTCKKETLKKCVINLAIMFIAYFGITTVASLGFQYSGISPNGLKNTETLYKFAAGFNQDRMGDYSRKLNDTYFNLSDKEKKDLVYNSTIGSIGKLPELFMHKLQHFWLDSDIGWSLSYLHGKTITIFGHKFSADIIINLAHNINQLFIYVFFTLAAVAIWINRRKMNNKQFLLLIILLVYTGVYLLIECTPRYAYTAQIFMFIMSAYAIEYLIEKKNNKQKENVENKNNKENKKEEIEIKEDKEEKILVKK